ncbi:hypothetical protein O181_060392 [Austropuccinia psidii MF-1]|uniref:Uncharacterized protein n=1 Tax=Austropuccinia psidii MF-1 TaxID=1389203 RepID=A0A9Q3HYD8_9BASI|nr:hypothetical protein [Austropuccinia psidii MF-1]
MTDGGGTEGEYSVSSVTLELMTKEYASRRFKASEVNHFKPKKNDDLKEVGLKLNDGPPQSPFWTEFTTQDLPCSFWEVRILMVLDPSNGPRPWDPWSPRKFGLWGSPMAHGP